MAEEKLDLLDLDDEIDLPELPEEGAFCTASRPRRPWLLFGAALIVVILATYIIVRIVTSGGQTDSMEIDLIAPADTTEQVAPDAPASDFAVSADKVIEGKVAQPVQPAPVAAPSAPAESAPVREVEDRKEVVFKPDAQKVEPPKPRPVEKKPEATKPAQKPAVKPQAAATSNYYVQFGSYSTRAGAESAQKKLKASHASLFSGKQFVILAAQLPNGSTTYRLRVGFTNMNDANGFCRNAKSDGLDCYVAK